MTRRERIVLAAGLIIGLPMLVALIANPPSFINTNVNANDEMKKITRKVADNQIKQFEIAQKNGGSVVDVCVQAGLVTAALLQDQDARRYADWKQIEKRTCKEAGLDR